MIKLSLLIGWVMASVPLGSPYAHSPVVLQDTVPIVAPPPSPPAQRLIAWRAGPVECAGALRQPVLLPRPSHSIGWGRSERAATVTLEFSIDATGRPASIRIADSRPIYGNDLTATLAAARFSGNMPADQCRVTYQPMITDIDNAPREALLDYMLFPSGRPLAQEEQRQFWPADGDCFKPTPAPRLRAYPDFKAIPQPPGTRSWSMIGFDIDGRGRPINLRVDRSTGNVELDKAAVDAVSKSRFEPRARRGCIVPFWRTGATLAAPAVPEALLAREKATCAAAGDWKVKPRPVYPDAFRRRGVEGWAVIGYDVAPWGQTGNWSVIASEPSADFGQAALNAVRLAVKGESPQGASGCLTLVRFKIEN